MNKFKLNEMPAWRAAELLASRELSATDVMRACLDRSLERDAAVCAFAHLDPDAALAQARALDAGPIRGPLHGLPLGVKDLFDTADMPTSYGSPIYAGYRPKADAASVALCREAGALVLGKTVTTEFAGRYPGKTSNPHDSRRTPGGSSSGSAAAVADFMIPLAIGNAMYRPLCLTIIFGLISSTVMSLFVVPALYVLLTRKSKVAEGTAEAV